MLGAGLREGAGSTGRGLQPSQISLQLHSQCWHCQPPRAVPDQCPASTHAPGRAGAVPGGWLWWRWKQSCSETWGGCSPLLTLPVPALSPAPRENSLAQLLLQPACPTPCRSGAHAPMCPPRLQAAVEATPHHHKPQHYLCPAWLGTAYPFSCPHRRAHLSVPPSSFPPTTQTYQLEAAL